MAKDILGNIVRVGDKIHFNGLICTVKEISENRLLGGKAMSQNRGIAIKIPDNMVLELDITFDADKPINAVVVKTPPEIGGAEA